jgi:hypothetical protein
MLKRAGHATYEGVNLHNSGKQITIIALSDYLICLQQAMLLHKLACVPEIFFFVFNGLERVDFHSRN